jgi:hypothetical protein
MFPGQYQYDPRPRPPPPYVDDSTRYYPTGIHTPPQQYPTQDRYNYPPGLSRPDQPPSSYYPPHFAVHHPFH